MRRLVVPGISLVLTLLVVLPVGAHGPDPILMGGLYPLNAALEYRWAAAGTPPAAMRTAFNEAADDATASRKSKAPSFAFDSAATNLVYYGADVPCGINGLACLRRTPPDWFGVWFRENNHRFDWGTLKWCELSSSPDGCYEIENVALDELGHVMVLDHHDNFSDNSDFGDSVVQTYSRTKAKAGWNAHVFARCDVATLQQQYDVATWSTLYSTCMGVPTDLTMTGSAASVVTGSMVTFTAVLKSDGAGRLAGNPMSGRVVVLQQRTSSGWADVLTMGGTSASGTYTGTTAVRSSVDYRALFRKPSSEGALSTWSSAVPITITAACTGTCPLVSGGPTK